MGKPTGFLEFERQACSALSPSERCKNYHEFRLPLSEEERKRQAARCMNCGVPFCQSGENFGGAVSGCPLHNLIPEWNDAVYGGHWKEALVRLLKTNSFPEFTGRVCPALCEAACTAGMNSTPVTVHDNELAIIERAFREGWMAPQAPKVRSGKRVAVVGSGPAGLAVADALNRRGHSVTVYEREKSPGGLLVYGIPNMKLEKEIVARRVRLMEEEGVAFLTGRDIACPEEAEALLTEYDATVLCCGAKKPRDLNIRGRNAVGIAFAVDYLSGATARLLGEQRELPFTAEGKDVVIVGGGDTGNDCVATAIRQGCRSVVQLEMMPKPPEKRSASNPWPQWPRVLKTDYGQEEAIALFGNDPRLYETTAEEIETDENGCIRAVLTARVCFETDENGRRVMHKVAGSEQRLPCGLLLIAAGFVGCEDYVAEAFGLTKGPRGTLPPEKGGYATGRAGLFAAGDARRGQSLVVWAIAEGRACAEEVDAFLQNN